MHLKAHLLSTSRIGGFRASPAELRAGRLMRAPDDHVDPPEGETAEAKAAREAAEAAAASAGKKDEDAAAALAAAQAELEAARARIAEFEGIDPAKAKENADKVAAAEAATAEAKKAAREAEKARAAAENDVAKLREIQAEEHAAEIARVRAEKEAADKMAGDLQTQLNSIRVENAFANARFISEETILNGTKAQRLFGDYVDVVEGQVVVYDAPRGDPKRATVMDSKGKPLPFNEAITKVINADPDKDSLLKSKTTPGAGSKTVDGKPTQPKQSRHERLAAGIESLRKKNAR